MNGRHDTRRRVHTPDEIVWCLFACIDSCRSISWSSVHCRLPCLPGLFCKWSLDLSPMECATRWNISEVEEEEDQTLCTWAMARKAGMDEDHWYFYCLFTWIRAYQRKEGKGLRACLPRPIQEAAHQEVGLIIMILWMKIALWMESHASISHTE